MQLAKANRVLLSDGCTGFLGVCKPDKACAAGLYINPNQPLTLYIVAATASLITPPVLLCPPRPIQPPLGRSIGFTKFSLQPMILLLKF
ncbi:hypothetical protein L2E82_37719 [Cichorium intybus]|uniref:Uncharacterized protein n=1 Tax=Cichorium intybus TaxID=13427 RepID=A0ACB9AJA1_CICIN|nr:hypothetical protein L2E82_37719 [Cichorium intybus]